jgi:periplasmic protein TonB
MLAYVFLILAATPQAQDEELPPVIRAAPTPPKDKPRVICDNCFTAASVANCSTASPIKWQRNPTPKSNADRWVTANDYPAHLTTNKEHGTVAFRLTVDQNGKVATCDIALSSGFAELDNATCSRIIKRARFNPAFDKQGNPVVGQISGRVHWSIAGGKTAVSTKFLD